MECPKCHSENRDDSHFCRNCGTPLSLGEHMEVGDSKSAHAEHHDLEVGTTFMGRYRILAELGKGGMGVVYKAEDSKLRRHVALKFLPWQLTRDPEAKRRFVHEAQAASALDHPGICTVHEIDETSDGQMYISMGCYDGLTLRQKLAQGPLDLDESVDIGIQIAEGLREAHDSGIVHRDIKPSNIMVTSRNQVKVMDFGLAKLAGQPGLTKVGTAVGTVSYMSPEQTRGKQVDQTTDIWSLGVLLYEMATGRRPFAGEHDQAVIFSILNDEPAPMADINPNIPVELEAIVNKCLKKNPAERYRSAADLVLDLKSLKKDTSPRRLAITTKMMASTKAPRKLKTILLPVALVIIAAVAVLRVPTIRSVVASLFGSTAASGQTVAAILPFDIAGGETVDRAFCDGMAQFITGKLERLERFEDGFFVLPAEDVRSLGSISATEARRSIGASVVITGVMRSSRGRVELQLMRNDFHGDPGDDSGTGTMTQRSGPLIVDHIANLSTWQDSILVGILSLLDLDLPQDAQAVVAEGRTSVPRAYMLYLRGLGCLAPYRGDGDTEAALGYFKEAVEQDPSYAVAYAALGRAYLVKQWTAADSHCAELAVAACNKALEIDHRMARAQVIIGGVNRDCERYDDAIYHYELALRLDPFETDAYSGLGYIYRTLGNFEAAEQAYLKAIEQRPHIADLYHKLGFLYYQWGKYELAIKPFSKLIELRPHKTAGYTNLGGVYCQLERWPEAREVFEQSLAVDSTYFVCSNLGTIYFAESRYADAIHMYRKALSISDKDYQVWGNLAESCYWSPGDEDRAAENFKRAVEIAERRLSDDPDDPVLLSDLASYYGRLDDSSRVRELLERVTVLEPHDPVVLFRIAETYEDLGSRGLALEWIRRALESGLSAAKVERYPGLRELRSDPEYRRVVESIHSDL